jgi:hypothetical protein
MIQKSKIRKSWYASSRMSKEQYYEYAVEIHDSRKEKRDFLYHRNDIIKENIAPEAEKIREKLNKYHYNMCNELETILEKNYRMAYSASHCEQGKFLFSSTPDIYVQQYSDWNIYSKSTKYPAKVNYNVIKLPRFFELPPQKLRVIDGLVNIEIKHYNNVENINVFKATWVKQEKGNNVSLISGFIAHQNNVYYHGITEEEAIKGVQKKYKKLQSSDINSQKSYSNWKLTDYISRTVFHKVTGACMEGIKDFCNKAEIPDNKKRVQIQEIMPLLQKYAPEWYRLVVKNAPQLAI